MKRNVGILIFNKAEVLDFAGPFEVFSVASELNNYDLFNVFTVSETMESIEAVNGLSVNPKYSFDTCPHIDILIIAGGVGSRTQIKNKNVLNWVNKIHSNTEYTLSICSGSLILATLKILDNKPYCTHHQVYNDMDKLVENGKPQTEKRFTYFDKVYTSGGISAGIDLSFHIVEKIFGKKVAKQTAKYMEYNISI